jgi:hypothetical protein
MPVSIVASSDELEQDERSKIKTKANPKAFLKFIR